ncbi:MAG TPA: 5'-nucleotidase [Pyrinomonadaceae bacterium]
MRNALWAFLLPCLVLCGFEVGKAQQKTAQPTAPRARVTEQEVNAGIPDDPALNAIIAPYSPKVRELEVVIGRLDGELKKEGIGGGTMGNFVADALRERAQVSTGKPVELAITNKGGLRKNVITPGELRVSDIFELLPFENALVVVQLTGDQLRRLLDVMMIGDEPAQAGARIRYRAITDKKNEIVGLKLIGPDGTEREIDPAATYNIVTIDYLVNRGGEYSAILKQSKQIQPLGITMRDAVIAYVKNATAAGRSIKAELDGRYQDVNPPQKGENKQ